MVSVSIYDLTEPDVHLSSSDYMFIQNELVRCLVVDLNKGTIKGYLAHKNHPPP